MWIVQLSIASAAILFQPLASHSRHVGIARRLFIVIALGSVFVVAADAEGTGHRRAATHCPRPVLAGAEWKEACLTRSLAYPQWQARPE